MSGSVLFLGLDGDKDVYDHPHVFRVPALEVSNELMGYSMLPVYLWLSGGVEKGVEVH